MKEIEHDGFITRDEDLTPPRNTCFNCHWYAYDIERKCYRCYNGRQIGEEDWRQKYSVCDRWIRK